ncbi:MAG TPA: phage tail protein [Candidatus Binataceae bacterium]|nr:phage tail protein [Candidatus Binataceae bacterium]
MAELSIQPSINDLRSQALLVLLERLDTLDLVPILVYRIESVPDSALTLLAWQFDMLDPEWQLAVQTRTGESWDALTTIDGLTDIDTLSSIGSEAGVSDFDSLRTLLKSAIPLHRTRGTPYSIKAALLALGWSSVTFLEGQASWNGTNWAADEGWAVFRVYIQLAQGQVVAPEDANSAIAAINFFKPMRAWLDSLWFVAAPLADLVQPPLDTLVSIFSQADSAPVASDALKAPGWPVADSRTVAPLYDGRYRHTGITYGANEPAVADSGVTVNGISIDSEG